MKIESLFKLEMQDITLELLNDGSVHLNQYYMNEFGLKALSNALDIILKWKSNNTEKVDK